MPINIEIKARCNKPEFIRTILTEKGAVFKGIDHQIDTYFNVKSGRLKLREGNIENHLIHYHRVNQEGPKKSVVSLYQTQPDTTLKKILTDAIGIKVVVDKQRAIYYIDNVKFHLDVVQQLGNFVEIEAIDTDGTISEEQLQIQCADYLQLFQILPADLLAASYSDMLEKL